MSGVTVLSRVRLGVWILGQMGQVGQVGQMGHLVLAIYGRNWFEERGL